jgi:hypothetical protein
MFNRSRLSRRRLQLSSIIIVVLALTLLGSYLLKASHASTVEAATPRHPSPNQEAGHIIVQLFQVPGFIYPAINGVPEWTLYADGLLIFKSSNSSNLVQTHLSSNQVSSILNVILQQNTFFASTHASYGRPIPDAGSLLLSVNINGIYKQVRLYGEPATSVDAQTRHIFAIKNFLHTYHPAATQPYIPPGIALLAIAQNGDSTNVPTWPYHDISLAQTTALECPFLSSNSTACPSVGSSKTGVMAIFGTRGLTLLQQAHNTLSLVQEQGKLYRLVIWPLLPDALIPRPNGVMSVLVQGANTGTWPLIISTTSNNKHS